MLSKNRFLSRAFWITTYEHSNKELSVSERENKESDLENRAVANFDESSSFRNTIKIDDLESL